MPVFRPGYRATVLAVGALTAGTIFYAVGASASSTETTTFTSDCHAQLVQLSIGGQDVLGALDPGRDCDHPGDSFFPTGTIAGPAQFPFAVDLLFESTSRNANQSQAEARAGVAHVFLPLSTISGGNLPDVTVDVLTSESACNNGAATGDSHVVGLDVDGQRTELPAGIVDSPVDLSPLAFIEFNKATNDSSSTDTGAGSNPRVRTTTNKHSETALHLVLLPGAVPGPADLVDLTIASTSVSCKKTTTQTTTVPPSDDKDGWMNGGGTMVDSDNGTPTTSDDTAVSPGSKISHGFVLPCHVDQPPPPGGPNLVANGDFGKFKLDQVTEVHCTMNTSQGSPQNPQAEFNTMDGKGKGTCNGKDADISWHFTDEGEPNTADEATLHIHGGCAASVVGILTNGNNQAHPLHGPGANGKK